MHRAEVKIICDSISPQDIRLTTFQLRYWRPIHSELMTHRVFSRNAGSSRARPSAAIIEQVRNDYWGPLSWGQNQPGMQASQEVDDATQLLAENQWGLAAQKAADRAEHLLKLGLHKQVVNRLLEPFTYIDVLVTSTQYANWFALRNHKDADPTIQDLARRMFQAFDASNPVTLKPGEWHLPYIELQDHEDVRDYLKKGRITRDEPSEKEIVDLLKKISTARCARISYKPFDGSTGSIEKDLEMHDRLVVSQPVHASPAEHQATPDTFKCPEIYSQEETVDEWAAPQLHGNLTGWIQYRKTLPNEFVPG